MHRLCSKRGSCKFETSIYFNVGSHFTGFHSIQKSEGRSYSLTSLIVINNMRHESLISSRLSCCWRIMILLCIFVSVQKSVVRSILYETDQKITEACNINGTLRSLGPTRCIKMHTRRYQARPTRRAFAAQSSNALRICKIRFIVDSLETSSQSP